MNSIKLIFVMLSFLLLATSVFALPLTINSVKIDGDEVDPTSTNYIQSLEKDQEITVKVKFTVDDNASTLRDVQVEGAIRGYDHNDLIGDITSAFDAKPGRTYTKTLDLTLPVRMEQKTYKLRVRVEDADGDTVSETYELEIEADNHAIWVKDVMFNPTTVEAGRAFLTTVRVENVGNKDENDGVRIAVSVPELGLGPVVDYIDELDEEESTTSEELFLRVPKCTKEGVYDAKIVVTYHDGDEQVVAMKKLSVVEGDSCEVAPITPVEPANKMATVQGTIVSQSVVKGSKGTIYPVMITNNNKNAETYTVTPVMGDWGSAIVSPSNVVVVNGGQTKTAYVYVTASDSASAGDNFFAVSVAKDGSVIEELTMTATVVEKEETTSQPEQDKSLISLKQTLEVVLIVVLILLVLLGLVIGFKKLTSSDDDKDDDEESYY